MSIKAQLENLLTSLDDALPALETNVAQARTAWRAAELEYGKRQQKLKAAQSLRKSVEAALQTVEALNG